MSVNKIVTLLTDFGWQDIYVGVMKGVIASINPQITVIDLTHDIPPQDIGAGRFCWMNAYPYFPSNTVHIGVVDPGVGSQRRGVAVQLAEGFLVAPDNGLLSGILDYSSAIAPFGGSGHQGSFFTSSKPIAAVELTNSRYWRTSEPSTTFHGRDIFASVGAYLASGIPLEDLGEPIPPESLVKLSLPKLTITNEEITGCIQYSDRFGNLITNIPAEAVSTLSWSVVVNNQTLPTGQTYSDVPVGELLSLIGSHGWIEIALNQGSAKERLQLDWGDEIKVRKY